MKINLPNGCSCSEPMVYPTTWERKNASVKKAWYIHFRFYDPTFKDQYPEGYPKVIKGMNSFHALIERQDATRTLLAATVDLLKKQAYNPISGYFSEAEPELPAGAISPESGLLSALQQAFDKKKGTKGLKKDLKSVLKYVSLAAKEIHIDETPVKDIRRRHVKQLLEQCGIVKTRLEDMRYHQARKNPNARPYELVKNTVWSANNFNFYRSHLMMLFEELCEWDTIENNPCEKIKKQKHAVAKRKTLTPEQRDMINDQLFRDNYRFWRLMHLFFDSGSRESEMVLVKKEHVNIDAQEILYTIFKGQVYRQEVRPISIDMIPLWKEVLAEAKPGEYLFTKHLKPSNVPISADNAFTRRWKCWVKNKKNDQGEKKYGDAVADMYSLKHSHSTEVSRRVGTRLAALHNQHTEAILKSNYDVEGDDRDMKILKGLRISFVPDQIKKPA